MLNIANIWASGRKAGWGPFFFSPWLVSENSRLQWRQQYYPPQQPCLINLITSFQKVVRTRNQATPLSLLILISFLLLSTSSSRSLLLILVLFHVNKAICFCCHFHWISSWPTYCLVDWTVSLDYFSLAFLGEKNFPDLLKPNMNTSWFPTGWLKLFQG